MPRSKRDKKVSLTQTSKKGLVLKQKLIEDIQSCANKFARVFTFIVKNMRNVHMKEIRGKWPDSRFFFGKNKVMRLALGKSAEDEFLPNLHQLSGHLQGETGLLFTNEKQDKVQKFFNSYKVTEYARSGNVATDKIVLKEGPLPNFPHSIEPQLRQLGLPTTLKRGVVTMLNDYKVCDKGEVLTPEKARILKLFEHPMAEFRIIITGVWTKDGSWKDLIGTKLGEKETGKKSKAKPNAGNNSNRKVRMTVESMETEDVQKEDNKEDNSEGSSSDDEDDDVDDECET